MDQKETAKAQAMLGVAQAQDMHPVVNLKNQTIDLKGGDVNIKATLFIKGCEDCTIDVHSRCTKIMIEGCRRTKVVLHGKIMTEIVEAWKCADLSLEINTDVKTLQLDICRNFNLKYQSKSLLHSIVWAGVYDLSITYADEPTTPAIVTGFEQVKPQHPDKDISPITDQFIMRYVKGELLTELVVRLQNGYPTTDREANEFDTNTEKNKQNAEEFMLNRLREAGVNVGRKPAAGPKVGRNDPCTCSSGKKFKNCCGKNTN